MSRPPLRPAFTARKRKILSSLSLPSADYTDLSPKGSVDERILPLIQVINSTDGLVTTSSCAGRISVFLEGRKDEAAVGGKGGGGRWMFVSHEPVDEVQGETSNLMRLFNLNVTAGEESPWDWSGKRMARFQFEPLILHVLAASLHHAQPVLTAAINAGFRESGLQSLRNLTDPDACPVVAIRTTGLALESIIGYVDDEDNEQQGAKALVEEAYVRMLVSLANARFADNSERMERLMLELSKVDWGTHIDTKLPEDKRERWHRKRFEGLERKRLLQDTHDGAKGGLSWRHPGSVSHE